ncbi:PVC-type heme-binding CxxCH protein [Schlesneria sp.]|uniref:PVC-type heme-binding CxxCH protein n=1 Tax=Schlesneria sp. TaxID=2762018 RepID=UPI002F0F0789
MTRSSALMTMMLFMVPGLAAAADGPLPPKEAAASISLPEGFRATLFAGEPDVSQPMSITFDDRGRMWVVECRTYPKWQPANVTEGTDRILILEDVDGDGQFDKRTVFLDKGVNLSSVEFGFGGVFVTAIPKLIFIPDANGDDVPDGPAQVLLDGFDVKAIHNVANSLTWGPDGWLYGCNGILSNSRIGKPGTPDAQRVPMNCGIWRYHPVRHDFEVVAHGTTNPWGLAFDDRGEAFLTNCVIEHVFHVVPGSRFKRMFGQDFNPMTFELMQTCADHIHWAGGTWEGSRDGKGKHGEAGGGHAHSGAMIYVGDQFPAEYHNNLFTLNIHGQRLNRDLLERHASGYVARHQTDFAPSGDPWFRGVCVKQGPDGIYFTDWSDTGECHNYDDLTIHRGNGRIFKVTYGTNHPAYGNLAKLSDDQLIDLLSMKDGLRANSARRILQERSVQKKLSSQARNRLNKDFDALMIDAGNGQTSKSLQYAWTLHAIGELNEYNLNSLLRSRDDTHRGWGVRLALEEKTASPEVVSRLAELARRDSSPYVRLQLASGLQRLQLDQRKAIAAGLVSHASDAPDTNLVLLTWYGIEPLISLADDEVLPLALQTKIPKLRQFIARHLATRPSPRFAPVLRWLEESDDNVATQRDVLTGLYSAIEGRRDLKADPGWAAVADRYAMSSDANVRELSHRISLVQGSDASYNEFVKIVQNDKIDAAQRERALADLVTTRRPGVADLLLDRLGDSELRASAIRGLAGFDREEVGSALLGMYALLTDAEKLDAISTLTAREKTALALVSAVDAGQIDRQDLSEFDIRQLQRFKEPKLKELVNKLFGAKPSTEERAQQIASMKKQVLEGDPQTANPKNGRALFQKNCASCHTLFGEGRQVGPDLTGAQRTDLDYILINVMDPSALVGHAYRVTIVELKDGRVINGIVKGEDASTITLQTATDRVVVATQDIEDRQQQSVSMMPEGLLNRLSIQEVRDLVSYLSSEAQPQ